MISSESFKSFFLNHVVNGSLPCNRMNKDERLLTTFKILRLVTVRCSKLVCASKLCGEYMCFIIATFD